VLEHWSIGIFHDSITPLLHYSILYMKTLIIGASGCLGGILYEDFQKLGPVTGTYCGHPWGDLVHLDVTDPDEVRRVLVSSRPNTVLHCGAFTHVDGCEEKPDVSQRINVEGTRNVVEAVRSTGVKYVFFSTDYVFDGKAGPYREEDPTNPIQVYGRHKLDAERIIKNRLTNYLIVRAQGVFGWERQRMNFVQRLIENLRAGKSATIPNDQFGSPTYAPNLSEALQELIRQNSRGIYHLCTTTAIDRYSFARLIARVFELDEALIVGKSTAELNQKATRPLKSGLLVEKAKRELKTRLWSTEEALQHMRATEK